MKNSLYFKGESTLCVPLKDLQAKISSKNAGALFQPIFK